jgi:hypothetical protein
MEEEAMRALVMTLAAGLALGGALPLELNAQGRGNDRGNDRGRAEDARGAQRERDRQDERRRADSRRDDRGTLGDIIFGRDQRGQQQRAQQGPPFCRNGSGHPVHGMRWCRDKGFSTGSILRWERAPWDDVILRNPRRAANADVGRGVLGDILDGVILGRVDSQRRALGLTDELTGRWYQQDGMAVLRLSAGGVPVAEFIDRNGNGRADAVRINAGR